MKKRRIGGERRGWGVDRKPTHLALKHRNAASTPQMRATARALLHRAACRPPRARFAVAAASPFTTLAGPVCEMTEVKRSKFITTAWPVSSPDDALARIKAASDPSASHNVWAFRVGGQARCSDDGEPSGTAGKPILAACMSEDLHQVAVLCVRHFGGVKLGSGGLTRAYGAAARACLRAGERVTVKPRVAVAVAASPADIGAVYSALDAARADRAGETYSNDGGVRVRAIVGADAAAALADAVVGATAGRARVEIEGDA